jgi:hypothetical protein
VELWALGVDPMLRINEVHDRLRYEKDPMEVLATRFDVIKMHPKMAALCEVAEGASAAQGAQLIKDVASELGLKSSKMKLVYDVCHVVADIRPLWSTASTPGARIDLLLEALREREQREKLTTSVRSVKGGEADGTGTSAPLTAAKQREWSNVLNGENSRQFAAIVAAVDQLSGSLDERFLEACDIIFRGVKGIGPCHACQDFLVQSEDKAPPAVHACFAQWAVLRRKVRTYFAVRTGMPKGGDVPAGLLAHEMSKAAYGKFVSGDLDDSAFDYLKEAWQARAAALGCEAKDLPRGIPEVQWLLEKEHYEVGSKYITALMSARGLSATVAGHSITDVAEWCKGHWDSAPPNCRTTLKEHINFAKKVFRLALHDMGDHCVKVRKLGRLDQPPLQYHIPPSSQVWALIKGADLGVQEAVRMRTNTPAMANAVVWAMHQLQVQNESGASAGASAESVPAVKGKRKLEGQQDLSKVEDHQLSEAQLAKRESNRQQRKTRKEAKAKDAARFKQTRLDGTREGSAGKGAGKGAGGLEHKRKAEKGGG